MSTSVDNQAADLSDLAKSLLMELEAAGAAADDRRAAFAYCNPNIDSTTLQAFDSLEQGELIEISCSEEFEFLVRLTDFGAEVANDLNWLELEFSFWPGHLRAAMRMCMYILLEEPPEVMEIDESIACLQSESKRNEAARCKWSQLIKASKLALEAIPKTQIEAEQEQIQ